MSRKIIWDRITFQGFGCYGSKTEFRLQAGLNNLVAGNEHGKSTLAAGLAAVLFGLPNLTDPDRFGKGRYRSFRGGTEFRGEVEFLIDGQRYAVQRDFQTDRVALLQKRDGAAWKQLAGGEHRTGARRRNVTYEDSLADLIGIASLTLFWSTFCVGQPLPPPDKLNQEVQQLLSGAGVSGGQALAALEAALQEKTRYTADLGVGGRNKNKDRQLEELKKDKEELEREIAESQESVDALYVLQEKITQLSRRKKELDEALEAKQRLYEAWGKWRNLGERYDSAVQEQGKIGQALKQANTLKQRLDGLEQQIAEDFRHFQAASPEIENDLDNLISLDNKISDLKDNLQANEQRLLDLDRQTGELARRLQGPLAIGAAKPDLAIRHQELTTALGQLAQREETISQLDAEENEARRTVANLDNFKALGDRPFVFYRQMALTALDRQTALEAAAQRIREGNDRLTSEYAVFNQASEELLCACRDFQARKVEADRLLADAAAQLQRAESGLAELETEQAQLKNQYADIAGYQDEMIDVLAEKLALADRRQRLAGLEQPQPTATRKPVFLAAGLILALIGAMLWTKNLAGSAAAFLAIGLAVALYGLLGKTGRVPIHNQAELAQINAQLAAIDARLGAAAAEPLPRLAAIHERLKLRRERQQEMAAKAERVPTAAEIERLKEEVFRARAESDRFDQQLQPVLGVFPDPQAAFRDWKRLQEDLKQWETDLRTMANRYYRLEPQQVFGADPSALEGWLEVSILASAVGQGLSTVSEAADWLRGLTAADYERWGRQAGQYQQARQVLHTCQLRRQGLEDRDQAGKTYNQRQMETINNLRRYLEPFSENTSLQDLKELLAECDSAKKQLDSLGGQMRALRQSSDEIGVRLGELQPMRAALAGQLEAVLPADQPDPQQAKRQWQQWRRLENERQQLSSQISGLAGGWNADDLEQLELIKINQDNAAQQLRSEWSSLVDAHPGLPGLALANQRERLQQKFSAVEAGLADLKRQQKDLETSIFQEEKQLSSLRGRKIINIAAARDRVDDLKLQCDRVQLEAEALALAYRELAAASESYSATYRDRLAETATEYFVRMTGADGRQITLDYDFAVAVLEPNGQAIRVSQLSQGTQDQLQIALRLAIADLVAGDYLLPLVFDDPFLNFDQDRLQEMKETLFRLADQRQILVLSHQVQYRDWGEPIELS